MLIRRAEQTESQAMDIDGAAGVSMQVMVGRDDGAPNFAMRRFTVAPGGHTPLHQHNYEHEVIVVAGKGVVRGGETHRQITAGDVVFMPPNKLHQFKNTGDDDLQFICLVPVQFNCADGSCKPTPGC